MTSSFAVANCDSSKQYFMLQWQISSYSKMTLDLNVAWTGHVANSHEGGCRHVGKRAAPMTRNKSYFNLYGMDKSTNLSFADSLDQAMYVENTFTVLLS